MVQQLDGAAKVRSYELELDAGRLKVYSTITLKLCDQEGDLASLDSIKIAFKHEDRMSATFHWPEERSLPWRVWINLPVADFEFACLLLQTNVGVRVKWSAHLPDEVKLSRGTLESLELTHFEMSLEKECA